MDFTTICRADSPRDKYFFTLYGGDDFLQQKYEEWKESFPFDDQLLYLSYQVEQGKDNEMKHLQGMLQLMQKKRMHAVKKILKSYTIHLEGIRDAKAAVVYVNKMDTRVGEHVTLGDLKSTKDKTSFRMRKAKNLNNEHSDLHNFNREENMFEEMVESHNIDDSVITGEDKHQCKERITCPGCYDIFHTPEDYADHTCTNERRPQLDDEPRTKKAKDIITCPGCNKVFNTLESYADHPCMSRQQKTQDKITCRACYKVFNTLKDYADHRCAKPPAHVGKGKYMFLTLGKYMLLKLVNICF